MHDDMLRLDGLMRIFVVMLMLPLAQVAAADIYKCQDAHKAVIYQDKPCAVKTLGTVKDVPPPSQADALKAQRDLERMMKDNRYYDKQRRAEWEEKQKRLQLLEAQEQRDRERMAAQADDSTYIPLYAPGYGYRHRSHYPSQPSQPTVPQPPKRPCVIGYVGDASCR